ncbi:MAG: sn-glycerol-3-phosphate ABC transporter ATP-binding protein UgpC [Oscillospiraceae bacterium]|nr:sn-glycerol-3-phosphate ABC transporter ATP-binding protein UgpC [Oscillospiraceae bacterium]
MNIKKIYDNGFTSVHEFNLEIADKEFIVLVGPSGCGKSTTLRMVAGLEDISEGELYIGDRIVNDVHPKDRDIAMVFQNYALYPHLTVYENMAFALKLKKTDRTVIDGKVRWAAELLGISDLLERKPKRLSGGQRQRVAIGRAIVREPKVFLMDEPLSNLDAKMRNLMRAEIIRLRRQIDTTFIYVTHDQVEAMTLGDRIVVMSAGHIQQIGTPQEVFRYPKNMFVAGFIGTPQMNFFPAKLKKANGYTVEVDGAVVRLPEKPSKQLAAKGVASTDITLGIRPEHVILTGAKNDGAIGATVTVSEMMGSEIYLHISTNLGEAVISVALINLPADHPNGFKNGEKIYFSIVGELAHLFDAKTEQNLLHTE